MKLRALCRRTTLELVRDPLTLGFGLGFPLVLLFLLSAIQANIPVSLFEIDRLTPGITVFGLAFVALFSATLVSRDRESALLQRLYTTPLTAGDFIFGYVLPLLPMAAVQVAVCYLAAIPLGLTVSVRMLWAVLLDLPAALLCGVHGLSRQETAARTEELSRALGLEPILARRAGKLSGGWQRRLSIAMALIARPEILFLDEPTLGLDVLARAELWDVVRRLKGRITVILTTHYLEEAEALSDRVGIMKDGRLLALGTPEELKRQAGCDRFEDAFIAMVREAGR